MYSIAHVTHVELIGDFRLRLAFDDGLEGEVDFAGRLPRYNLFAPLADPAYFAQVRLDEEGGTIAWPNGLDIAPDTLHMWVQERHAA
jgi:hypothetical protein